MHMDHGRLTLAATGLMTFWMVNGLMNLGADFWALTIQRKEEKEKGLDQLHRLDEDLTNTETRHWRAGRRRHRGGACGQ